MRCQPVYRGTRSHAYRPCSCFREERPMSYRLIIAAYQLSAHGGRHSSCWLKSRRLAISRQLSVTTRRGMIYCSYAQGKKIDAVWIWKYPALRWT